MPGKTFEELEGQIEELRAEVLELTIQHEAERLAWLAVITFLQDYCSNSGRMLASGKRALNSIRQVTGDGQRSSKS